MSNICPSRSSSPAAQRMRRYRKQRRQGAKARGPSISGPLRKGGSQVSSIVFEGQAATLILGTSSRQIAA
jgi:hypothetical protein